jgi:CheY-like chemotaxis protein
MPEMDGFSLYEEIRKRDNKVNELYILLLMTSDASSENLSIRMIL